jgi:hypothetical protein
MSVRTPHDIPLFDGVSFVTSRTSAPQSHPIARLDTLVGTKDIMRLSMDGKGQKTLACVADK